MYQNSSIRPISLLSQDVLLSAPLNSTAPLNTLHRAIEANAFAISESIALTRESHYFSASNPPSLTSPPRSFIIHPSRRRPTFPDTVSPFRAYDIFASPPSIIYKYTPGRFFSCPFLSRRFRRTPGRRSFPPIVHQRESEKKRRPASFNYSVDEERFRPSSQRFLSQPRSVNVRPPSSVDPTHLSASVYERNEIFITPLLATLYSICSAAHL